jgi:hypothetical protein
MMHPSRRADDPTPRRACTDTDADASGNNPLDTEAIREALHALVDGLTPDALHALWDVLAVFSAGPPPAEQVWQGIEHTGPRPYAGGA